MRYPRRPSLPSLAVALFASTASLSAEPLTVLFTHDIHSTILPRPAGYDADGEPRYAGGLARIAALAEEEARTAKGPCVLLDAGDFTMGTAFHTICREEAAELRLLGAAGFDATAIGNHELDFRPEGLARMLESAVRARGTPGEAAQPLLLASNIEFPPSGPGTEGTDRLQAAFKAYGAERWAIVERGGLRLGLFGLIGRGAVDDSPYAAPLGFGNQESAARESVRSLRAAGADVIVCLSHSGTSESREKSEDQLLAAAVPGIDVIVSGHSHTRLDEPIVEGDTIIVSAHSYGRFLGRLVIDPAASGAGRVLDYELLPVVPSLPEDPLVAALAASFEREASDGYFGSYGLRAAEPIAELGYRMDSLDALYDVPGEHGLGNLITDSFRKALREADPEAAGAPLVGIYPLGLIRDTLYRGPIDAESVFRALSLGIGLDGSIGYPLARAWVSGADLLDILEVDASVSSIKGDAYLSVSGVRFAKNPRRLLFDRVIPSSVLVEEADGTWAPLDRGRRYAVVIDLYAAKMIDYVGRVTKGVLAPRILDREGGRMANLEDATVYVGPDGRLAARGTQGAGELKSWVSLARMIESFPDADGDGLPDVPTRYAAPEGRIRVERSISPALLFGGARWTTLLALGLLLALLFALALGTRAVAVAVVRAKARRG